MTTRPGSNGDGLMPIRTGIHPYTRRILSLMHSKGTHDFVDRALESDHPFVDGSVRREMARIDRGFVAVWELQGDGEPRWHIYRHWSPGKMDEPTHFLLLSDMTEYVPLDWAAVEMARACHSQRDPVKFVEEFLARDVERKGMVMVTRDGVQRVGVGELDGSPGFVDGNPVTTMDDFERSDAIRRHYRRLFKRNAWGSVGNCWERGSELPWHNVTPAQRNEV